MRKATLIVVASIAAAGFLAACSHSSSSQDSSAKKGTGKRGKMAETGPIPVTVATVAKQDMPVYLNGLGSVVAFNTATILAQVSGQLVAVPFKEGDEVAKGALLAQVDPRPFQATLDQAIAKKAQDAAALVSAKLDLKRYQDLLPDGYVTGQQVDQQKATVDADAALVQADEASIKLAGIGSRTCSYWLSNQNHKLEGTVWIYGFWSGLNYVAVSSQQDQPKTDSAAMAAAVEAACRAQPSRILATAAWAAYIDSNQQ